MTDIAKSIKAINPNAEFSVNAEDYNQITWLNGTTPIAIDNIKAKQAELQKEYDNNKYQRDREIAYPSIQDQLDMQYWDKVNGTTTWQTAIAKVKSDNPKGQNMAFATIDVTKGITGTIPVANGGTGLASGTSGQFLKFTGSTTIASAAGGGITEADNWRLTTSFQLDGATTPLVNNLERVDGTGQGYMGTGMSVSSGIWTFPSTGIWRVDSNFVSYGQAGGVAQCRIVIQATTNDSTYTDIAAQHQANSAASYFASGNANTILDVTDTSNVKVRFSVQSSANANWQGSSAMTFCGFMFIRLGDT